MQVPKKHDCHISRNLRFDYLYFPNQDSRGDADSWYFMIQKIFMAISVLLDDSFQGLEEGDLIETRELFC
ncbi:hypothetical protein Hdeb2414_s0638g00927851 [Helianthus debilis subsp. tardiflorus]